MHPIQLLVLLLAPLAAARYTTREVYRFSPGSWLENIAVRPSGTILVSMLSPNASLYEINPFAPPDRPSVKLLHTFPNSVGILGITETTPDTFYIATGSAGSAPSLNLIYRVTFPGPRISLIANITSAMLINGIAPLNPHTLLAADSIAGSVYAIDTTTGSYRTVITDPLMTQSSPAIPIGINGIKLRGSTLFFTNTAQALLAKIALRPDGTPAGAAVRVASSSTVPPAGVAQYDDFALSRDGAYAYAAIGAGNVVQRVCLASGATALVAGALNSTVLAEPTAAAFGRTARDERVLYVTTAGAMAIPVVAGGVATPPGGIGGQLVAVDLW